MRRTIDYARAMADETLEETLFIRITKADKAALDRVAERIPMKPSAIARLALRIGLAEIEKNPGAIFAAGKPTKKK